MCPWSLNAEPEDQWTGRTGFVHQAVLQDFADLSGHQVYACGAPIVVDSAKRDYVALGWSARRRVFCRFIHVRSRQGQGLKPTCFKEHSHVSDHPPPICCPHPRTSPW